MGEKLIKDLINGKIMTQPQQIPDEAVRTNGQDTILNMTQKKVNDRKFLRSIGSDVLKIQFDNWY